MFDMQSNNFDKHFRDKLQNLKAKYKPEDWEMMEQKLDAADAPENLELEDVLIDGMAFGNLENLEADYNPAHWALMDQKLDYAYSLRRKLYRYKVAEIGLMLLIIFTIIQFLPVQKQKSHTALNTFEIHESAMLFHKKPETATDQTEQVIAAQPQTAESNPAPVSSNTNVVAKSSASAEQPKPNSSNDLKKGVGLDYKNNFSISDRYFTGFQSPFFVITDLLRQSLAIPANKTKAQQPVSILMPINPYSPGKISASGGTPVLSDCHSCQSLPSSLLISIGVLAGADADYITTPYDEKFHQKEFSQIAMGYSGGLTLGIKYHKWELETGAIYSAKYYGSRNIFEVSGSFEDGGYVQQGLLGVQLDIVRVPLHLRYYFMDQNKWNVYAHSGASFNMTVETLYEYTSQQIGNTNELAGRRIDPHAAKNYDGILEGGNFIDNTFVTANLGLGVERFFNSRMSIFLGSTYHHQVTKGLGPQNDKINSLSIMTGARILLKSD